MYIDDLLNYIEIYKFYKFELVIKNNNSYYIVFESILVYHLAPSQNNFNMAHS